jgi:tetratricopeptide (TPR) repeat protein
LLWIRWNGINCFEDKDSKLLNSYLKDFIFSLTKEMRKTTKVKEAENLYKLFLNIFPNDKEILGELGRLYYLTNQLEKALEIFENVEKIDPDFQI